MIISISFSFGEQSNFPKVFFLNTGIWFLSPIVCLVGGGGGIDQNNRCSLKSYTKTMELICRIYCLRVWMFEHMTLCDFLTSVLPLIGFRAQRRRDDATLQWKVELHRDKCHSSCWHSYWASVYRAQSYNVVIFSSSSVIKSSCLENIKMRLWWQKANTWNFLW